MKGGPESSKLLIRSYWWSAPMQEPSLSPLRIVSLEQNILLSPRKLQGFQSSESVSRSQKPKMILLVLLSLRKLQGFPLCLEPGADITVRLFFISHHYTLWVNSEHWHTKCWQGCKATGTLIQCCWKCKMVPPHRRQFGGFFFLN